MLKYAKERPHHMPCITYESPEDTRRNEELARKRTLAPLREEIDVLREKLRERDAMLCAVLTVVDRFGNFDLIACNLDAGEAGVSWDQISAWWQDHLERDAARREKEALRREQRRREILARLTNEEREILGL